jgi:anti-sigma factor ChrR (cupin superfamily)
MAYCLGSANSVAVWVVECHLLLCQECRDSVAEIDKAQLETSRRDGGTQAATNRRTERRVIR